MTELPKICSHCQYIKCRRSFQLCSYNVRVKWLFHSSSFSAPKYSCFSMSSITLLRDSILSLFSPIIPDPSYQRSTDSYKLVPLCFDWTDRQFRSHVHRDRPLPSHHQYDRARCGTPGMWDMSAARSPFVFREPYSTEPWSTSTSCLPFGRHFLRVASRDIGELHHSLSGPIGPRRGSVKQQVSHVRNCGHRQSSQFENNRICWMKSVFCVQQISSLDWKEGGKKWI